MGGMKYPEDKEENPLDSESLVTEDTPTDDIGSDIGGSKIPEKDETLASLDPELNNQASGSSGSSDMNSESTGTGSSVDKTSSSSANFVVLSGLTFVLMMI